MRGQASVRKAVRVAMAVAVAVAAGAAAVWRVGGPGGTSCTSEAGAACTRPSVAATGTSLVHAQRSPESPASAGEPPLPVSLRGSLPPRLPLDGHGQLAKSRAVRDFFDYFLTTQHEVSPAALDAMVRREIAAQVDGTAAQQEALDVWRRYVAYRDTVARVAPVQVPQPAIEEGGGPSGPDGLEAMRSALDQRTSIADRAMGTAWSEAFFGREWRRANYDLARLRVATDGTLTDAQKAMRLQALADMLPPDERAASERKARRQASVTAIAALQRQGLPPDELRAAATQALGSEAAQRVVQMQKEDDAWRAKYEDYAAQRARIDAMGLAPAERDARIAQWRERSFASPGERLRAASLDQGGG